MRHYKATNLTSGAVIEYDALLPQAEHLGEPWVLEDVVQAVASPSAPPPSPPTSIRLTKLAFRSRFTPPEKVAIELASLDVPGGSLEYRAAAAQMRVWLADIEAAQYIDLNYVPTRAGVQALEGYGLIAAGRSLEILDTAPTADEVWYG